MTTPASVREFNKMASGDWSGLTVIDATVAAGAAMFAYLAGIWQRGSSSGQLRGEVSALKERITALERRDETAETRLARLEERINDKVDAIEARVGLLATRAELDAIVLRLENRLYDLVLRRPPPPPLTLDP